MPSFDTPPDDPLYRAMAIFAADTPPLQMPAEPDANGLLPTHHSAAVAEYMDGAFTTVDGICIETTNDFFRTYHYNVAALGGIIAPAIMEQRQTPGPFRIYEAACSKAKDTWSMAAALALHDVDFRVDAVDANPVVLEQAQRPYKTTMRQLEDNLPYWGLPREALDFFQRVDAHHIQPIQQLRDRVTFKLMDIRHQAPGSGYDAAVINNVLCHYAKPERVHMADQIVRTVTDSLRPEGFFTFSDPLIQYKGMDDGYFARHGLLRATDLYDTREWNDHVAAFFGRNVTPLPWRRGVWDTLFAKQAQP